MRKYLTLFLMIVSCVFGTTFLQQSTPVSVPVGPFTSYTDGFTLLSGPTVTGISLVITKSTGTAVEVAALAASGTANDLVIITTTTVDCMGMQELQATDLDQLGVLTVLWYDADQIFPIKQTYFVVDSYAYALLTHGVSADSITATGASKLQTTGKALVTEDGAQTSTTTTFYYSGSNSTYVAPGAIVGVLTSGGLYELAEVLSVNTGTKTVVFKYPLVAPPTDGGIMYLHSSPSWKSIWRSLIRSAFGSNPN